MRTIIIRVGKILSLVFAILMTIEILQHFVFLNWDSNSNRVRQFYREEPNSIDVIFVGASELCTGFSPAQAYKEKGFTSYLFSVDLNQAANYASEIREIQKTQSPSLYVIDVSLLVDEYSSDFIEPAFRRYWENIPWSSEKMRLLQENISYDMWLSYIFPIVKYHENWPDLRTCRNNIRGVWSFDKRGNSQLRGVVTRTNIFTDGLEVDLCSEDDVLDLRETNEKYLINLLDYLKEAKIENVLFVMFPHRISNNERAEIQVDRLKSGNKAGEIVSRYGYDFINFEYLQKEIGLDFNHDFYNNEHLNVFGMQKMTSFLSEWLCKEYSINGRIVSADVQKTWNESVECIDLFYAAMENDTIEGKTEMQDETTWSYQLQR